MPSFTDECSDMVSECFDGLGASVTYIPTVGESKTIQVIDSREDVESSYGGSRIKSDAATFEVRVADVAAPKRGDKIVSGGKNYIVKSFQYRDPLKLVWFMDCAPD